MPTTPIRLSDEQMSAILAASHPLPPDRRSEFLEAIACAIATMPELGDGLLHRTIVQIQKDFWSPPQSDNGRLLRSRYR